MTPQEYIEKLKESQRILDIAKEDLDRAIDRMQRLDTECQCTYRKRNWCINRAITYYLEYMELRWLLRNVGDNENNKKLLLNKWLRQWIPEGVSL